MDLEVLKNIDDLKSLFIAEDEEFREKLKFDINQVLDDLILNSNKYDLDKNGYIRILENVSEVIIDTTNEIEFEEILSKVEKELIKLYMETGLFEECIRVAQHLSLLTNDPKDSAFSFVSLMEASIATGNIELERQLISNLHTVRNLVGLENIWFYLARFFSKTDAKESLDFIDKLMNAAELSNDIELKYKLIGQVVTNYFYLGHTQKALDLVEKIKVDYKQYLEENELAMVYLEHNTVVLMHNIDKNEYVVNGNLYVKQGYKKLNDRYNYLMTCVNLADGYMGIGKLQESEDELKYALEETKKSTGINSHSIAALCYANTLSCRGKNSVALYYYEEGIRLSKEIEYFWDVHYGQIWRMLTLSEMGEYTAIDTLFEIRDECIKKCFDYLIDLAACFILVSSVNLNLKIDIDKARELVDSVDGNKVPGLKAHINAAFVLLYNLSDDELIKLLDEIVKYTLLCEGIKGRPQLILKAVNKYSNYIENDELHKINVWLEKYVSPIIKDIKQIENNYFMEFNARPKISGCNTKSCMAICCYDGVYIDDEDEMKLIGFIEENRDEFNQLPRKYIVDGNWKDVVTGRKTAVRKHKHEMKDFPKHFNMTNCVFAGDNGICQIQKVATKLDLHPWKYKPKACWMLPITVLEDGEIIPPPKGDDKDPCYFDESYPGYVKFLPCGIDNDKGKPWYKVYKQEIIWGKFLYSDNEKMVR